MKDKLNDIIATAETTVMRQFKGIPAAPKYDALEAMLVKNRITPKPTDKTNIILWLDELSAGEIGHVAALIEEKLAYFRSRNETTNNRWGIVGTIFPGRKTYDGKTKNWEIEDIIEEARELNTHGVSTSTADTLAAQSLLEIGRLCRNLSIKYRDARNFGDTVTYSIALDDYCKHEAAFILKVRTAYKTKDVGALRTAWHLSKDVVCKAILDGGISTTNDAEAHARAAALLKAVAPSILWAERKKSGTIAFSKIIL